MTKTVDKDNKLPIINHYGRIINSGAQSPEAISNYKKGLDIDINNN